MFFITMTYQGFLDFMEFNQMQQDAAYYFADFVLG